MLSALLTIASYVALIGAALITIFVFIPLIIEWFGWCIEAVFAVIAVLPSWVGMMCIIMVVLAAIGLGVKLL